MNLKLNRVSVAQVFDAPGFAALVEQYTAESCRDAGLIGALPDRDRYEAMEAVGLMRCAAAFADDGGIVGLCFVLISPVPHYKDRVIATVESIFLLPAYRKGGAGLALLDEAKLIAQEAGAAGLYVSAPSGGRLERILPRIGFAETNRIFYSVLKVQV